MRTLSKLVLAICIMLSMHGWAQTHDPKKCSTFDRYKQTLAPGIDLKVAEARPDLQTSVLSPSKHFRIHFDTTGANAPAMVTAQGARIEGTALQYVDTVAKIFDSVWTAEVTTYGFAAPPSDGLEGGGSEYDVYIQDRGPNNFGQTMWDDTAPLPGETTPPRFTSFISIDNDFGAGFRTIGMPGAMSTAAHEFQHAIQIGTAGLWNDDLCFYEMCAESMEPTVFPSSKDYVNDISTYFRNIENISLYTPYTLYAGYERAIWGIFLMKRHGTTVMREIWETIATVRPVQAMKTVLERKGYTLQNEFSEFCTWNYFTGPRADSVDYYPDAKLFPVVNVRDRETLGANPVVFQYACKGFGVNYLEVRQLTDTATFIISNVNTSDALGSQSNSYGYQLRVAATELSGTTQLPNRMYAAFTVPDPANWKYTPMVESRPVLAEATGCYPNPYTPSAFQQLRISLTAEQALQPTQTLSVYSSSYDCVFAGSVRRDPLTNAPYAVWDGKTTNGDYLASGVYLYVITAGGTSVKGKFAVRR
ncbi:MAG TPA: MXAN_6640 family putative metalloprotease [Bacteroidota bacterium]|nr:MXAN_6640 family putative metalloprotease [Bacteroidota bacterium]